MGLKTIAKKFGIKKILQEVPIVGKLFNWLNDPTAVARKRTIAAIAAVIAGALRGLETAFRAACDAGDFIAAVCKVNPGVIASFLDNFAFFLNTVVVQGADIVTVVMAVWGLWDARNKSVKAVTIPATSQVVGVFTNKD